MNEEDEAFEELALKQGQWGHIKQTPTSGWRKKQIMDTQAFPNPHRTDMTGMTLRDYFAAKAMQALITAPNVRPMIEDGEVSGWAYKMADAMLKAREA